MAGHLGEFGASILLPGAASRTADFVSDIRAVSRLENSTLGAVQGYSASARPTATVIAEAGTPGAAATAEARATFGAENASAGGPMNESSRGYVSGFREIRQKAIAAKNGDVGAIGELEMATLLRSEGTNVHFQTPVGPRGPNTADFLVGGQRGTGLGGEVTDVLTPRTSKPANVLLSIADKNDQAPNIIVNLRHTSVAPQQLGDVMSGIRVLGAFDIRTVRLVK
jgi:hypothetical protein